MTHPQPSQGGSYIRDPDTGALTPEGPEAVSHPIPDAHSDQPVARTKSTPKGGQ